MKKRIKSKSCRSRRRKTCRYTRRHRRHTRRVQKGG